MDNGKILQFKRDDKFYFKKGSDFLRDNKVIPAIEYFHKAKPMCKGAEIYLLYFMLAQAYYFNKNLELSNLYYFMSLREDLITQSVFRGLGENFALQDDVLLARFYLNQCANMGKTPVGISAKDKLLELEKTQPKFLVIDGKKCKDANVEQARDCMAEGKFEKAIELYEQNGNFENKDVRCELALAYFFVNDTNNGKNLLLKYGQDTVPDLCNLLLIYYSSDEEENYEDIKKKIRNLVNTTEEEKFKIGLTFAQTNDLELAIIYMENYLIKNKCDVELEFFYVLTLINAGYFEKAKRRIINLKKIDPLDNYIFDYYLDICNNSKKGKFEYIFNIPVNEFAKVQAKIKSYLVLNPQDLRTVFSQNTSLFYYIAKLPASNIKNLLLLKLASVEGKDVEDFFNVILLSTRLKTNLKNSIAIKRAKLDSTLVISLTKDNIYTKICLPNMQVTKINNMHLYNATISCVDYLLNELPPLSVSLGRIVVRIERRIKTDNVSDNVLSAYLSWECLKVFKMTTLSKICRHFKVLQEDLYKFLNDYKFEI